MKKIKSNLQKNTSVCYMCGKPGTLHPHHVFNGAFKRKAEEDGMVVYVHDIPCHRRYHDDYWQGLELKAYAQGVWEKMYGSREQFTKRYKQSYIDRKEFNAGKQNSNK